MQILITTSNLDIPDPELGLVNITEFKKAKEFLLKALSEEDKEILKSVYQFDVYPLEIKEKL